jgi:1-deoxy-D-xylulose-5-phosphate reductoisomerase
MGPKITIDSATMMNKGLELIEAQWLFDLSIDRIDVVVHPQSLIHSFVEMIDGSLLAQLGVPDMRLPIAYALLYPDRADLGEGVPRLDPRAMKDLTFEAPDEERFPCLAIAKRAGRIGGTMPAVMNAANERAVSLFLEGRCAFTAIPATISAAMSRHEGSWVENPTLDQILDADRVVRSEIRA